MIMKGEDCRGEAERSRAQPKPMNLAPGFQYVYILESSDGKHFYTGLTADLAERLAKHNAGAVPHTMRYRPWRLKTAVALRDRAKAAALELYLKTSSGRAFAKKRL